MKRWPQLLLIPPALLLSFFALRHAFADYLFRSGSSQNIERAARMFPSNPEYQARAGNLKRSLELNPYQPAAWIELSADAEAQGDFAAAERHLLRAAEVDAMFEPRWALANFYFRRERREEFWKWMRLAAERSYGDRAALFQLAAQSGASDKEIQSRLVDGLGETLGRYVEWLSTQKRWEAAGEASLGLIRAGQRADAAAAIEVCHQLVDAGHSGQAVGLWNALGAAAWIPGTPLPGQGTVLTNAKFEWKPTGKAFDWRLPWRPGLEHRWRPGELTIALDGREEERTDLLEQVVAVRAAGNYELRFRYRAEGLEKNGGVRWRARTGRSEMSGEPLLSGEWRQGAFRFTAPAASDSVRLVLSYERLPGTRRPEATIVLEGGLALTAQK